MENEEIKKKNWFIELLPYILVILAILFIKRNIITTVVVNGDSMLNTLHEKDIMLLDKVTYRFNKIKRFDIIVIQTDGSKIIKRVIGLPGETVEYYNDKLYINGEELEENYGKGKTDDFEQVKVGENEYFVLGDNREVSLDSRALGNISKKKILGKATFTIFPFNRIGNK